MLNPKIHEKISHSFYIDKRDKKKKKLSYCSLCRKGPFVEEDEGKEFSKPAGINFCNTCMFVHNFKVPSSKEIAHIKKDLEPDIGPSENDIEPELDEIEPDEIEPDEIEPEKWFVFTVQSPDKTFYHGMTQNVEQAIKNINRCAGPKNMRSIEKKPVKLIKTKTVTSQKEAYMLKMSLYAKKAL